MEKKLLDPQTLKAFAEIISEVDANHRVHIRSNTPHDPFEAKEEGDFYKNLGVLQVSVESQPYSREDAPRISSEFNPMVPGLKIVGPDYDTEEKKICAVFCGFPTYVSIYRPAIPKEPGLDEAIDGIIVSLAEMVGMPLEKDEAEISDSYQIRIPLFNPVKVSPVHATNVGKLRTAVHPTDLLSTDTSIVDVVCNGGHSYFDMLVTAVIETPDGVIVGFRNLKEYQGIRDSEILLRLLIGQNNLPVPNGVHYCLIQSLEEVNIRPAREYAAAMIEFGHSDEFRTEPTILERKIAPAEPVKTERPQIDISPEIHHQLVMAISADGGKYVVPDDSLVTLIHRGREYTGLLVTAVEFNQDFGLAISYRDIGDYKGTGISAGEAFIRLVANQMVPAPPEVKVMVMDTLAEIQTKRADDFAAETLLRAWEAHKDIRKSGRSPLQVTLPETLQPKELPLMNRKHLECVAILSNLADPNVTTLDSNQPVVGIQFDGGKVQVGMIVTEVQPTENGVWIRFRHLETGYEHLHRSRIQFHMAAGKNGLPLPEKESKMFVHRLETVTIGSVNYYGARKLAEVTHNLADPVPEQPYY